MGKFYKILLLSCFFALTSFNLYSQQINLIRFNNTASYTPGSGVSVIINPTGVFDLNNQFILELSNTGGAFTSPTVLNTLNDFYVPAINGVLPNSLAAGTYKLRVRSTNPVMIVETNSFNVINGGAIQAPKAESTITANSNFINCINCNNEFTIFGSLNRSDVATVGSGGGNGINVPQRDILICGYDNNFTYTINLTSKIDVPTSSINTTSIPHTNGVFTLPTSLGIGTYIFEIQKSNVNSTSVYSIVFLFHGNATSLGNSSSEQICVNENVTFAIDKTITGIGRNYYGSKYSINFGDGTIIEYTHAQLLELSTIDHTYTTVSCNETNGSYLIEKDLFNKGINNACSTYNLNGNGVAKNVNTSSPPTANFEIPSKQCINTNIFADNTTIPGSYGSNGCLNEVLYYWYYKRPGETSFTTVPSSSPWINSTFDLTIPSSIVTLPGCWEIKLLAVNPDFCQIVSEMVKTIKIEAVPTPTFTNTPQSPICAGTSVLFSNTSNILNIPCQEPIYSWTVTPVTGTPATSTGYQFIAPTNASSQNANILFTQPGSYSVVLNVSNSCGTFASTPQIIEVFGDPTVSFNPNTLTICDAAPAGYTIDFSQVGTTPTYSVAPYAPTSFIWTITGPGVTSADYSFVGGTNANSQYPQINFTAFKTYIITVQVNGNCAGSNQASFTFLLKEMPVITNSNLTQSICTGGTTSPINLTSSMASGTVFNWVVTATNGITGFTTPGTGNTIPGATLVNPSNTTGTVTYTVTPSNNGCVGTPVNFVITVNPAPLVPAQAITTCTGNAFTVSLSNNPPSVILPLGTTFTWTVTSPVGITGASNQTTPVSSIGQTLVNTTNAPIDVIYTITASTGTAPSTCSSNFTLTVTVNPRPQIPNQTLSVCSGNAFNLSLSNNPPSIILPSGTTYTWTVTPPVGITGASNQNTPTSTIAQTLLNSTSNPINVIYNITTIYGSGSNTCSSNFTLTVTVNPAPSATISGNASVCQNSNAAVITFTGLNGVAPYIFTYSINGGSNQTITTTSGNSVTLIAPTSILGTFNYCLLGVVDSSTSSCLNTSNSCVAVIVNSLPTISTQPTTTQSICVGGTINPLTVAYTGGVGTATYQWYSNTTNANSGGTLIAGATNASYTPAAFATAGTYYFYATITLSGNGCGSTTSNTAQVIVVSDPIVDTQALATQTLCQSSTPTDLTITVSGGIGTFAYQWYSNTSNSTTGGTLITGATNATFTPPTATVGTQYYYCVVTQSGVGCNVTSAVSTVIIVPAPAITTQPASSSVCENGTPTLLTVAYTNGTGTPTYQWFSNTTNSTIGGTAIAGATTASYNPPASTVGTLYYYCEITFSSGGCTSVLSNTAEVVINPLPTVSTQPTTTQSICVGGTIDPLTVAYIGGVGTATYQWYSNTTNANSGGTLIAGATNASYTPAVFTTAGTYYFYATITLSGNGCGSTTSNTAQVIVVSDPIVDTQALATQTLCQSSTPTDLTISVSGSIGSFAYQWYSNTTNSTVGGTSIPGATNATFTPPTATVGTQYYYCVVTQSGVGCNATSAVSTVIIVAAPAITTQPTSSSVCENGTPTLLTVAYTNGTGTPTYQWFSNTTNSTIGGTAIAGATTASYNPPASTVGTLYYYCEITFSSGGCTNVFSNTAEVVINQIPVVNSVSAIICSGEQYIFNSTNSNDVLPAGLLYSWNLVSMTPAGTVSGSVNNGTLQNQFIQQLVNNSNGITTLVYEVTPIAGICTGNTFTITIEVYPRPDVTFDLPNQTICNETNTSLVTLNSTLPGNITYEWNATIPTGITGALSSGTNTILVQTLINTTNAPLTITYAATATFNNNGSSCEGNVYNYSITVNPTFTSSGVVSNYNGYNVSVFGGNDGAINLTTIGGSGTYTYNWTGPNGFTSTAEDISGLFAGTYTVTINDGYCAPIVLTFTLTQPPELLIQPDLSLTINLICFGDNNGAVGVLITQESVPPYDYELYNSSGNLVTSIIDSTNLNPQFTGLVAGVYSLTVIDANGGRKTVTGLTVTQPDDIIITATTTPITCYGANNASITLTVTGGTGPYQAQWDNLATGFYQNNLAAGNYSILVTDNNGCTKTIVVNIPEAPIFTINPVVINISCYGANDGSINLNLVGGIQPISLTWSDGSTAGLVRNNLAAGTYTVTIVDSKPCTIVRTFIIVEPQPLVLSANVQNALDCNNANSGSINLLVSGGTPPFTYSWSNGATTEDLNTISSGNYAVLVTDSRGCTKSAQYIVNRPQPLTLNVETDTNVNCETRDISQVFEAQVSGGVPPIQLSWSSGTVSGANNEFMTTDQDGLVVLTATDALGCTTTYSLNVDIPVIGNASFDQNSYGYTAYGIYSILDPIQFTNTATGDYVSLLWNFGDGTFSNEENPIHTYVLEGNYVVTQTVTYPFGCVYVHTISLLVEKGYLLVVPTAFTPNNDALNDTYRPVTKGLKNVRMDVYDTWGSLIYSETGDVLRGWDGTLKGVNAENGNYHCKVSAETFYGSIIRAEETFVLIK